LGSTDALRIEINGDRVDAEALWSTASGFGHFTAMQVPSGAGVWPVERSA